MGLLAVPGMPFQDSFSQVRRPARADHLRFGTEPDSVDVLAHPPGSHPCVRAQVSQAQGFTPLTTPGAGAGALSLFSLTLFLRLCFFEISFD